MRSGVVGLSTRRGFALLVVIWGLGVIVLLMTSYLSTARLRLQAASNAVSAQRARLLAEGAVELAIIGLIRERDPGVGPQAGAPIHDGSPRFCAFGDAMVSVSIEDETGKLDLNAAPVTLVEAMLRGSDVEAGEASRLARAIVEFREASSGAASGVAARAPDQAPDRASDRPFGPKRAPFQTVSELDQVSGMQPELLRLLLPMVTVHSFSAGVDVRAAPPALFAALARHPIAEVRALAVEPYPNGLDRRDPGFPAEFRANGVGSGTFTIHAEAVSPNGVVGVVETIVSLGPNGRLPFTMLETRRAPSRGGRWRVAGDAPPC